MMWSALFLASASVFQTTNGFHFSPPLLAATSYRMTSPPSTLMAIKDSSIGENSDNNNNVPTGSSTRRHLFEMIMAGAATSMLPSASPANAQLVQFPCNKNGLMNTYHFMRAGESLLEADNKLGTNPLFLTNRENGLSALGREQVHAAASLMDQQSINPSVVKFSLAANSMDSADIVGGDLQIGRNRLVPEYTYMDQRGVGKWDMMDLQETQEAVWAMDVHETGAQGRDARPPSNDDGTANESLYNQVTRLVQLISLLETFQSGDDILLIFPDGTGPALLSALIAGIPLDRVHEIHYQPGEFRPNISYDTVRATWPAVPSAEYQAAITRGQQHLTALRTRADEAQLAQVAAETNRLAQKEHRENERVAARQESMNTKRAEAAETNPIDLLVPVSGVLGVVAGLVGWKDPEDNTVHHGADEVARLTGQTAGKKGPAALSHESSNGAAVSISSFPELRRLEELTEADPIKIPTLEQDKAGTASSSRIGINDSTMQWINKDDVGNASHTDDGSSAPDAGSLMPKLEENVAKAPIDIPEMPTKEERMKAMDDYIESIGGGDAWLGALSDMMMMVNDEEVA